MTSYLPYSFHFHYKRDSLGPLYLSALSRRVAFIILSLFSPVYIYKIFVDKFTDSSHAVIIVLLYLFILFLVKILGLLIASHLSFKIGYKHTMRLSLIPFTLYLISLFYMQQYPMFIILAAALIGFQAGLYWWGYHGYFAAKGMRLHYGKQIGQIAFLTTIASILTPILSAVIITELGFGALFIMAFVFLVISLETLGKDFDVKPKVKTSLIKSFKNATPIKRLEIAFAGLGGQGVVQGDLWPLYLFLFIGSIEKFGAFLSVVSLVSAFLLIIVGDYIDKHGMRKALNTSSLVSFVTWLLRTVPNPLFLIASDASFAIAAGTSSISVDEAMYKKINNKNDAHLLLLREFALIAGQISIIALSIAIFYLGLSFASIFILAAVYSLFPLLSHE